MVGPPGAISAALRSTLGPFAGGPSFTTDVVKMLNEVVWSRVNNEGLGGKILSWYSSIVLGSGLPRDMNGSKRSRGCHVLICVRNMKTWHDPQSDFACNKVVVMKGPLSLTIIVFTNPFFSFNPGAVLLSATWSFRQVAFSCFIPVYVINFTGSPIAGPVLSLGNKALSTGNQ